MPVPPATQAAPSAERFPLLRRVLDLRTRELEAWTAFGDKVGQSMSAMGIANVHFMTQQLDTLQLTDTLEQASTWYARADAYLEGENSPAALAQRQTVRANGLQLELFAASLLLHKEVRVRGLVNAAHYNGRLGTAIRLHESARYEVRLHAVVASLEVHVIIHELHLVVIHERV